MLQLIFLIIIIYTVLNVYADQVVWQCQKGNWTKVLELIKNKKYFKGLERESNLFCPIHYATVANQKEIILALLKCGIDINSKSGRENRSAEFSQKYENKRKLEEMNIPNADILAGLAEEYEIKDCHQAYGATPLHIAVLKQNYSLVEFLLKHKAAINVWNQNGWTPLHIAAHKADKKMVELLLKFGANPNLKGQAGKTVIDITWDKSLEKYLKKWKPTSQKT